jgi:hypothetical protein
LKYFKAPLPECCLGQDFPEDETFVKIIALADEPAARIKAGTDGFSSHAALHYGVNQKIHKITSSPMDYPPLFYIQHL